MTDMENRPPRRIDIDMMLAAFHGRTEEVAALLEAGADPDAMGGRTLIGAVADGREDVAAALIAGGADVHVDNERPLVKAVVNKRLGLARMLLDAGARPDRAGKWAFALKLLLDEAGLKAKG
jgi:ankyrin repeat protein